MIQVHEDVLADPMAYRQRALRGRFRTVEDGCVQFHGIQPCADPTLPLWLVQHYPGLLPVTSFLRSSPAGQREPHYRHDDRSMGDVTAILYLTPAPPPGDGTVFWRHRVTGAEAAQWTTPAELAAEAADWFDDTCWEPVTHVGAKFNRLVIFPAALVHSRALLENYGETLEAARLIHVVFCTGAL